MPAWLLQVLAQYGLSEMMMKIKTFSGECLGTPGQFDIGKILEGVQTDDERVMQFMQEPGAGEEGEVKGHVQPSRACLGGGGDGGGGGGEGGEERDRVS